MQTSPNYNSNRHLEYSAEQLRLPLDLSVEIDKNDPMWTFLEVIKEVNLKKYLKKHRGNQGHNNLMMMKTVLFAYMNQVYSLREMEERCQTDIRFMYLTNEEKPSHISACRARIKTKYIRLPELFSEFEAKKIQGQFRQ